MKMFSNVLSVGSRKISIPVPAWVIIYTYIDSVRDLCNLPLVEKSSRRVSLLKENVERLIELKKYLSDVRKNGWKLRYVPEEKKSLEICLYAVQTDGCALKYVPKEKRRLEICLTAVRRSGWMLGFVPIEKRTLEICLAAVHQNIYALDFVSDDKRIICLNSVRKNDGIFCI